MFITVPNRFFVSDKFCGSGAFGWNSVHPFSKILRAPTNGRRSSSFKASLISNPDAFEVGKFIGSYGYMNVTSYSSVQSGGPSSVGLFVDLDAGYSSEDVEQLKVQDVGEGQVKIRLYEGRVALGPLRGARVIFKVYPGNRAGGAEADMMAANELNAHAYLQSDRKSICPNIQILLGGFETKTGEQVYKIFQINKCETFGLHCKLYLNVETLVQWLAFRNDGKYSAADYAKASSETLTRDPAQGENKFWNPFDLDQTFKRRHLFIIKLLHGAMNGLAYMHERGRLHQSIGPASVVLNTIVERDAAYLVPRLRDLAFSVDTCNSPLEAVPGAFSEGLWRRATAAGAFTTAEKKAFGIADDM
ncbi:uncharacterized protein [Aristolochia californica]|uniref:uncharacterized protein isoform X4 n=1 Tax=Aristolochia californica TaxID=171875 RepID=UPI0035DF1FE1